jgi:hypothetical protein
MANIQYDNFNDSDSEFDDLDYEFIFDGEEISPTRFNIVLCELFNPNIHGESSEEPTVYYHYLTINRYKKLNSYIMNDIAEFINLEYQYLLNQSSNVFPNYVNIIRRDNYIKPEIAECFYLSSGHCISILKTIWIKLIQRTWKKIYKQRKEILLKRMNINSLRYREIKGVWPDDCRFYPSIKGMLTI